MAQNMLSSHKIFIDLLSILKDTSQRANFERDYLKLPETCLKKKVGEKGLDWCHIGVGWRKVAQIGLNWLKLNHKYMEY